MPAAIIPAQLSCSALAIRSGSVNKVPYRSRGADNRRQCCSSRTGRVISSCRACFSYGNASSMCNVRFSFASTCVQHRSAVFAFAYDANNAYARRGDSAVRPLPSRNFLAAWGGGGCCRDASCSRAVASCRPARWFRDSCLKVVAFISTRALSHHSSSGCGNSARRRVSDSTTNASRRTDVGTLSRPCSECLWGGEMVAMTALWYDRLR